MAISFEPAFCDEVNYQGLGRTYIMKLFELSVSARNASFEMNMSYRITIKALDHPVKLYRYIYVREKTVSIV